MIVLNFRSPSVIYKSCSFKNNKPHIIELRLNWGPMGVATHQIYKKGKSFIWTDSESPIPQRSFNSLQQIFWEYELNEDCQTYIKQMFGN